MKQIAMKLPLHLDKAAVKQLDRIKELTGEKTSTKAIIKAMYEYLTYRNKCEEQRNRIDNLELIQGANSQAIRNFIRGFKELESVIETKQNTEPGKPTKGKRNLQLTIE